MKHLFLVLIGCLGGMSALWAQPTEGARFELQLSYDTIGLDETLTLSYTLHNTKAINSFSPPVFENAQLVAGPSISQSMSIINGHQSSKNTYTYVIKPQQLGLLFLPAMALETEAGWLELQEQTVVVVAEAPARPYQTPNPMVQRSPFDHPFFNQQQLDPQQEMQRLREMMEQPFDFNTSPLEFHFEFPEGETRPTPKKPKKERKTYRI